MSSNLENLIATAQSNLTSKMNRTVDHLIVNKLTTHTPIDMGAINLDNLTVSNLTVTNKLTANNITSSGSVIMNGSVSMNGSTNITNLKTSNVSLPELRDITIRGYLKVENTITAGGEIRGGKVWNAVWN